MNVSRDEFDGYVQQAMEGIDPAFRGYLTEGPVVVEDKPVEELWRRMGLKEGRHLLGLFQGVPLRVHQAGGEADGGLIGQSQFLIFWICCQSCSVSGLRPAPATAEMGQMFFPSDLWNFCSLAWSGSLSSLCLSRLIHVRSI